MKEIKHICSDAHDSILWGDHEEVQLGYSLGLADGQSLTQRYPFGNEKPLLCLLASMISKHYLPRVSFVQQAISVL